MVSKFSILHFQFSIKKKSLMKYPLFFLFNLVCVVLFSQPNHTANDTVPPYDKQFLVGINPGYNGNLWTDQTLSDIAHGNPAVDVEGIGMQTYRITLPESFLDFWGYEILVPAFEHYHEIGLRDLTVFLQNPLESHKDTVQYCPDSQSQMFANIYTPIWDNGENGTPVNDTNYAALYIYRTVSIYKDHVKFWEILNEPDFSFAGDNGGWKPEGWPGNWYDNTPGPCLTQLKTPVYHYIRLLKIAYEVIKTLDDDAFVCVGGIGFESYLDVLLRHTDNPVDGSVTAEYPLKGGAFFDVVSFHSYPHFNGTLLQLVDTINNEYIPIRHSDAAADGIINHQSRFQKVLDDYGYDGITFPKKEIIITETGIPSKQLEDWIGSKEAQKNYVMKVQIAAFKNDIRQIDFFVLANSIVDEDADNWLQVMGMYDPVWDVEPYEVTLKPSGIGLRTMGQMIGGAFYDSTQTMLMELPEGLVNGAAFLMPDGEYRYVLWAATQDDMSEEASQEYTFPDAISQGGMTVKHWDYSVNENVDSVFSPTVLLTGSPVFIDQFDYEPPIIDGTSDISFLKNIQITPNPFVNNFEVKFYLTKKMEVKIKLFDAQGQLVNTLLNKNLSQGQQQINFPTTDLASGVYFVKIITEGNKMEHFRIIKVRNDE